VTVTAVNYKVFPTESVTYKAPHFRRNTKQKVRHSLDCEWNEDEVIDSISNDQSSESMLKREMGRKWSMPLDIFLYQRDTKTSSQSITQTADSSAISPIQNEKSRTAISSKRISQTSTNSLETLVEAWLSAKSDFSKEEFELIEITIQGKGRHRLKYLFGRFENVFAKPNFYVMYGNATFKRYGLGFCFNFYDKINGEDVSLYVSSETMMSYRYHKALDKQLKEQWDYFTVYFIPNQIAHTDNRYSIILNDLHHIAVTGQMRKKKSNATL
jgi:hypothetical protein